ncbi:hypothetical protein [Jiangella alba]|uniref:Uncharacterized protein n=1 Tax=Jiangella alba TaxID=561176 RepID=A0A1H5LHP2_9ACTN|nr:hypothetical protein [Jiangella alba]SEE75941.1 hypothetical protein SAMN04488561_2583 [Jiangella alba]
MADRETDRWSDQGDPAKARRLAWMWVSFAGIACGGAGLAWLAWWVAQVRHYEDNWRGFDEHDGFPWVFVALCAVAGVWSLFVALRQWARARYLAQGGGP